MVIKILSSGSGFSGIKYNENKVSNGGAGLMAAENLGILDSNDKTRHSIAELEQFFKAWSTNDKGIIDKPQFHVAISCKGKEMGALELKTIAEKYIEKMGYKENPYLIYYHSDTANNHVHILSSRVNAQGQKINDSFERRRSQAFIKEELGRNSKQQVGEQVTEALTYNFSTEAQFKVILEGKGIAVNQKDGYYQFVKGAGIDLKIGKDLVDNKIKDYQQPDERIKQLKALFIKYKPALAPDKFAEFMQNKFGVEVLFHTAKGKDTPYGYTILDHAKKQVFKGSQIMKLPELLALATKADMLKSGADLITTLADNDQLRYRDFKSQLSKLGFDLNAAGQVKLAEENKTSFTIDKDRIRQLMYNDRLYEAKKFNITTPDQAEVIGKVMFLNRKDLPLLFTNNPESKKVSPEQEKIITSDKLNSLLAIGKDLGDIAKENNYAFAKKNNEIYLIDQKKNMLYKVSELTERTLEYGQVKLIDLDRISGPSFIKDMDNSSGTFAEVSGLLLDILEASANENKQEDKKKKRRME